MCGVVEGAIIKAEPGLALPLSSLYCGDMTTCAVTVNTVSTLCLPSGQPLTDANLIQPGQSPMGPGSPPTISIQETPDTRHTIDATTIHITTTSDSPDPSQAGSGQSSSSPIPYSVSLALPSTNTALPGSNPLSLSALLPIHPLPPTSLLPHSRSPLLSISEVTNTLLDHNQ